jgi:hypothetical protein
MVGMAGLTAQHCFHGRVTSWERTALRERCWFQVEHVKVENQRDQAQAKD